MPEPPPPLLDRLAEAVIRLLAVAGGNPTRLRWRWNRFRQRAREAAARRVTPRSAHRMCPACRSLVPQLAARCPDCGEALPGSGRGGPGSLAARVLPGVPPGSAALLTFPFAVFLLMAARAGFAESAPAREPLGALFSLLSFAPETLLRYGAGNSLLLLERGEWWRLVCPIFLHGGLLHLIFNTFIFVQIGPLLEEEYGRNRLLVLYVAAGAVGFAASQILAFRMVTVGGSGAIFGLVGAALVFGYRRGGAYGAALRSMMIRWTVYFLIFGLLVPRTDNLAHLGGLAAGAAFAALTPPRPARSPAERRLWGAGALAAVGVTAAGFLLAGLSGEASLRWLRAVIGG